MPSALAKMFYKKNSSSSVVEPPSYEAVTTPSPVKGPRTKAQKERDIALLMERYGGPGNMAGATAPSSLYGHLDKKVSPKRDVLPVYSKENVLFNDKPQDAFSKNMDKMAAIDKFLADNYPCVNVKFGRM